MTRSHVSQYTPPLDIYAAHRCRCRHLLYAGDQPGGRCRWSLEGLCDCVDHWPAVRVQEAVSS